MPGTCCRTATFRKRPCGTTIRRKLATGRVSGSLGVYYQVYDNFQVSVEELDANGNPDRRLRHAERGGRLQSRRGKEIAVEATDWLSIFGNVGYIDGGIDEDNSFAPSFPVRVSACSPNGRPRPASRSTIRWAAGTPVRHAQHHASQPDLLRSAQQRLTSQGPVTLVNARAG